MRIAATANEARTVAGPLESAAILGELSAMRSALDATGVARLAENLLASLAGSVERHATVQLAAATRAVPFLN